VAYDALKSHHPMRKTHGREVMHCRRDRVYSPFGSASANAAIFAHETHGARVLKSITDLLQPVKNRLQSIYQFLRGRRSSTHVGTSRQQVFADLTASATKRHRLSQVIEATRHVVDGQTRFPATAQDLHEQVSASA
jgi:hypothetical protein